MLYTTILNLKKPGGTDAVNVGDLNDNADIIDALAGTGRTTETIKGAYNSVNSHLTDSLYLTATGTGTVITVPITALTNGYAKTFIASANNSGGATTINGKPLYKPGTTTAPTLIAGKAYTVWYNLAGDCFFIKASAEGTATADKVLATDTFSNNVDIGIQGTIPSKTLQTYTPSTVNQVISSGQYLSGNQTILGDANLIASNLKKDVVCFGVTGNLVPITTPTAGGSLCVGVLDTEGYSGVTSGFTKVKEAQVLVGGTYRISFDIKPTGSTGHGRIYKNGVAVGTDRSTTTTSSYTTYTEDITLSAGDLIQLYVYSGNSSYDIYYRNFRLFIGGSSPYITINTN